MLKFQSNSLNNSKTPKESEDNSSDYNNDSDSLISPPPSPEKDNQFTLNVNGNGENATPQNFLDDSNGSNDEHISAENPAEQNDENFKGVINVEEEMNKQQEIDQENKRKLQIAEEEKIIFERYDKEDKRKLQTSFSWYADISNELKKENSIKGNVWACILSGLGLAIAYEAFTVLSILGLLSGVGEILTLVVLGVAAIAFGVISAINVIKIAEKNMENIKEQNKKGDREQKSPVKNICAAIFSGLGLFGVIGGFAAISILIFAEEILPLFAVALISFAFCACAMALINVAFYNDVKAGEIIKMNSENAKKEIEQEQNKENEGKSSLFYRSDSEMSLSSIDQGNNVFPLFEPNDKNDLNKGKDD